MVAQFRLEPATTLLIPADQEVPMAQFPCDHCGQRYRGPGNRAYIAILDGIAKWDHKPRLCPDDMELCKLQFDAVHGRIGDPQFPVTGAELCLRCRGLVEPGQGVAVFMVTFSGRTEREDWFARAHRECRPDTERHLNGTLAVA